MKYDFTTRTNRNRTGSYKWNVKEKMDFPVADSVVPYSVADMEFLMAPEIVNGLKEYLDTAILGYCGPTDAFYESVVDWMKTQHNWDIRKEWIVNTPGVVFALRYLVKAYSNPGEGIVILTPSYAPFRTVIEANHCHIVESRMVYENEYYTIDFEDLEKKLSAEDTTMMILCSPHNPTGRVFSKEELIRMANLCLKYNVRLVVDEIHHDLLEPGVTHYVLASLSEKYAEEIITCTSVSKSFNLAGMQASSIIIKNETLRKQFEDALGESGIHGLNMLAYKSSEIAYTQCGEWLKQCNAQVSENRKYLREFLTKELPEATLSKAEGTYLAWVDLRYLHLEKEEQKKRMEKHSLFFSEGYVFGEDGIGFERINLACPLEVLKEGLERLKEACNEVTHE